MSHDFYTNLEPIIEHVLAENDQPPVVCNKCQSMLATSKELRDGVCTSCGAIAAKQRREEKRRRVAEAKAEQVRSERAARDAARSDIAKVHGTWAARSEYYLNKQITAKRKQLLKILKTRVYNMRLEESRKRKAALADEAFFYRSLDETWYNSNPPRTCKVCGERKRLYDFPKQDSGRYGGHTCRTCRHRQKAKLERLRNPPRPRVVYTEAQRKEAARRSKKKSKEKNRRCPTKRINRSFSMSVRKHLRKFKAGKPVGGWKAAVGYSLGELKEHLEKLFRQGMSWENYGEWHVDHIRPKASFHFTSANDQQFKECWALSNLQPLWAEENSAKRDIYPWRCVCDA